MHDWRKAVHRTPISYTVANNTLRLQTQFVTVVTIAGIVVLFVLYSLVPHSRVTLHDQHSGLDDDHGHGHVHSHQECRPVVYNSTYPLTRPEYLSEDRVRYRIAVVADLDLKSKDVKEPDIWNSYLLKGYLTFHSDDDRVEVKWDKRHTVLRSSLAQAGRGMELSELIVFNGRLYACDDRTGVIFEVMNDGAVHPWVIVTDGDGRSPKGFKCEWLAVKNRLLHVGGFGKEWTTVDGQVLNHNPEWIKTVSVAGEVVHRDWRDNYSKLRSSCGIQHPGYVIHESGVWSTVHQKWFFLPRRASSGMYNEVDDEKRGTNIMLSADEAFSEVAMSTVGPIIATRGFSSFKFVPNTNDRVIVALKSEEDRGKVATYVTAFTVDGRILLQEQLIGNFKFEGIEFI